MNKGFTLIELLITIAIVAILSTASLTSLQSSITSTFSTKTGQVKRSLTDAASLYWIDMGFYPPDVNRGWDPGFVRKDPWNSDIEDGESLPGWALDPDIDCSHCPSNWQDILDQKWNGPYLNKWPDETAWGGEYDYNYWPNSVTRNGCVVSPGIYAGAQRNYENSSDTKIPPEGEQMLIDFGLDDDNCINEESQLLLHPLD